MSTYTKQTIVLIDIWETHHICRHIRHSDIFGSTPNVTVVNMSTFSKYVKPSCASESEVRVSTDICRHIPRMSTYTSCDYVDAH